METMKPIIFCFLNGGGRLGVNVEALAEDGDHLAGHFSSDEGWAKHDIGIGSEWKHDRYKAKYPDGYELVWVENFDHEGLQKAFKLNQEKGKLAEQKS